MAGLSISLQHCTIEYVLCNSGKFSCFLKNGLWAEAGNTATLLENNMTIKTMLMPISTNIAEGKRNILTSMQKIGQMCIMTHYDNKQRAKL